MSSVAFLDYQHYAIDQKNDSGAITNNVIQWGYAIGLPVVGILLLCFFLSLGGAFALLGPWAIFIAARLITRYWDKNACKIETIEIQRNKLLKFMY
jgi:hypothetical protein